MGSMHSGSQSQSFGRPARRGAAVLLSTTLLAAAAAAGGLGGCARPSAANIQLRKENASLQTQIRDLQRQHDADLASIRGLQRERGVLPTLPQDRLDKLFTVGSLKLTHLTGGANLDHEQGPDTGVRVYAQLFDTTGDLFKAAGSFDVRVFDLAEKTDNLVAHRYFSVDEAERFWMPMAFVYSFVLPVPWEKPPKHPDLTVRVKYVDELTQRILTAETVVHVNLSGPSSRPTTQPQ